MSGATSQPSGERERRFLEQAYWLLGSSCVAWSVVALVCVLRRRSLDIFVFGKVQPVEAIIFTQGAFCLLLPLLLGVVAVFRGVSARQGWRTRFPGVLADSWEVPPAFDWLRIAVFLALVVLPVATMGFCYGRMVEGLEIYSLTDSSQPPLRGKTMFGVPPDYDARGNGHDWRWRGEYIVLKDEEPARITAIPFWQPWIYKIVGYGSTAATFWFLFAPAGTLHNLLRLERSIRKKQRVLD